MTTYRPERGPVNYSSGRAPGRYSAHSESIGGGRCGLYLGRTPSPDAEGPEGYALVDDTGAIQWLEEDCHSDTYRHLPIDPTTGEYILPGDDRSDSDSL